MTKVKSKSKTANSNNTVLGAVKKVRADFKLTGISRPFSMTCEPLNNENIFWPKVAIPKDRFDALWNYCKGEWKDKKIAEIEHEGLCEDGTPINGIVVGVREI